MKYCPNCGEELREQAKFCPKCGFDLERITEGKEISIGEKVKNQFDKMKVDEEIELQLKTAKGMNVSRAEIKLEAQKKLSGRYGEWFKSILWIVCAGIVAGSLLFIALGKMLSGSILNSYSYYGYNYGYRDSFSGISTFFWFLVFVLMVVFLLLVSCLANAVMQWCAIHTLNGQQADGVKIFWYFVKAQKNRILKANVLIAIYTFLWSLLFTIPGIVKSASYAMTNLLLEKDSNLSAQEAIKLSREIMHGYKLEFLILRYSFYLWAIVNSLTLGMSNFYVLPYQNVTEMQFLHLLYKHRMQERNA